MPDKEFKFDKGSRRGYGRISIKQFVDDYIYRIDVDADYQRNPVWSLADQELLLDSIANDIDIPKLYLADVSGNNQFDYECIDGKQRILTLLNFYKPEKDTTNNQKPIKIKVFAKKLTYKELSSEHSSIAKKIDDYKLDFIIYRKQDLEDNEVYIRLIFKRLNLGYELNSGERLNAMIGTVRNFVFEKMGKNAPFFINTSLSDKRFSREFTLAQIVVNSFKKKEIGEYIRVRLPELENFFGDQYKLPSDDPTFTRIKKVLEIMEEAFGDEADVDFVIFKVLFSINNEVQLIIINFFSYRGVFAT